MHASSPPVTAGCHHIPAPHAGFLDAKATLLWAADTYHLPLWARYTYMQNGPLQWAAGHLYLLYRAGV
jgi:hypothetical protein